MHTDLLYGGLSKSMPTGIVHGILRIFGEKDTDKDEPKGQEVEEGEKTMGHV
jgi:hypothetical protein